VVAIERDDRCLAALAEVAAHYQGRLEVIAGDALAMDWPAMALEPPVRIIANLPYNIGTPLLTGWIEAEPWPPFWESLTLMFQREVAERIVAGPESPKDYGRLAVLCGWRTQARIAFDVPPSAFTPPPKVTSSVVELIPRAQPLPCDGRILAALTLAAFGQRRKMLRQSLKGFALRGRTLDAQTLLEAAGIEPTKRAEEVDVEGFVQLAQAAASQARQVQGAVSPLV
jgi:16S rRNA (adenine1518-N6/adenine1519-N6)-dimethyltransferase